MKHRKTLSYRAQLPYILIFQAIVFLGMGCQSVKPKPPYGTDGFHAPVPFNPAFPSAPQLQLAQLYASSRITVNRIGFQVGFVPVNEKMLDAYLDASGASNLIPDDFVKYENKAGEKSLAVSAQSVTDRIPEAFLSFALNKYAAGSFLPLSLGANALISGGDNAISAFKADAFKSMATQFNLHLLQNLSLPAYASWASPERGLPRPLTSSVLVIARNMDPKDWIWDRSIHSWNLRNVDELNLFRDMKISDMLVGGQELSWEQLADYMRTQDEPKLASQMESGVATYRSSLWLEIPSLLLGVAGGIAYATQPNNPPTLGTAGLIGGLVLGLASGWLHGRGRQKTHNAAVAFNAALTGLLQERAASAGITDWPK